MPLYRLVTYRKAEHDTIRSTHRVIAAQDRARAVRKHAKEETLPGVLWARLETLGGKLIAGRPAHGTQPAPQAPDPVQTPLVEILP